MNKLIPAGFWLRLLATLNEFLIFLLPTSLILFNISKNPTLDSIFPGLISLITYWVFFAIISMFYLVIFTHLFGGGIGKLITGLRIRQQSGQRLEFKKVLFRQLISYRLSALLFGVGFLAIFNNPNKQAWHDQTVDSNVFKIQPALALLGLLVFLATLGINGYLLNMSWTNFVKGSVKQDVLGLVAVFNQQAQGSQLTTKQQISKNILDQAQAINDLINANKLDEASKSAQLMLAEAKTQPEQAVSLQTVADVYFKQNNFSQAKVYYTKSLETTPVTLDPNTLKIITNSDPSYLAGDYIGLSAIDLTAKNYPEAVSYAQKAVELAPNRADYFYILGLAQFGAGNKAAAIKVLQTAIQLDPKTQTYKDTLNKIINQPPLIFIPQQKN